MITAFGFCTFPAVAQPVNGDLRDTSVEAQRARVAAAIEKLAPFQPAGCWRNARVKPLVGFSDGGAKGIQVSLVRAEAGTPLASVQPGDLLVSVDGVATTQGGSGGMQAAVKARTAAFEQLLSRGRPFVEIYRNGQGQDVAVVSPARFECTASDVYVSDGKSDHAGMRISVLGLTISGSRMALLNDDQLFAFLAWNQTYMALRHESNADAWEVLTLMGNGRASSFEYSSSAHEKIDWVTLTTLRAMNANLNAYGTMLSVVEAFDKAAGVPFLTDKRFIGASSGGSPFGGEEKQARLTTWVKLLEQDAQASSPASLKFSNTLLSKPTWSARTLPLTKHQTVGEALQGILGEAEGKEVAQRYMATFDYKPVDSTGPGHLAKAPPPPGLQLLYAHHPSRRLMWVGRTKPAPKPTDTDGDLCARAADCSVIVLGSYVVARPSPAWAQELSAPSGAYKVEEQK